MKFQAFPKIPRLFRDIVITEKLDGTNASVCIYQEPLSDGIWTGDVESWNKLRIAEKDGAHLFAGSRNRWITPDNDNYGFAKWVRENAEFLFNLGHGHHFGEWWGQGIQRGYGLKEKRFSLFNTHRWGNHVTDEERKGFYDKFHCYTVPVLYEGSFTDDAGNMMPENINTYLHINGSVAAPGFMQPEGIIVYHKAADTMFKVTLDNDDKPKGVSK